MSLQNIIWTLTDEIHAAALELFLCCMGKLWLSKNLQQKGRQDGLSPRLAFRGKGMNCGEHDVVTESMVNNLKM